MHILFLSHYFPPECNAPASRTYEHCREWVRAGHDVTVVTSVPNCPSGVVYDGYRNRLLQREQVDGMNVYRIWTYMAANKGKIKRTANYATYMLSACLFSMLPKKPDVLVATSPQFFCGWAGVISSKLRRTPFILEIRDIWPESIAAVGGIRNRGILKSLTWMERKMYKSADHIVTVGDGYKSRLLERNVPTEKISVVMNGIDPNLFHPRAPNETLKRQLGLEGRFVCSYIGTIGMACGLDVVLRAEEILRNKGRDDIAFLLVGDGAIREELEKRAKERGLDNIVFTGRQEKGLMPDYFSISDACLVHLEKRELFQTVMPSKVFEAQAMARPIILGVEGFASDMVRDSKSGICIEPENEQQLVEAVQQLADHPQQCRNYGESGNQSVLKRFTRDRLARDYLDIIQSVAARKRGRRPLSRGER